jgi:hypothetical protein
MTTLLIIIAVVAAIYLYATLAFYYGFKNWYPLCGCSRQGATQVCASNGPRSRTNRRPVSRGNSGRTVRS